MKNGLIIDADGNKFWYQNGKCHRLDGPAIEWSDGSKSWCQNGQLHRLDGPAYEDADGTKEWYQNGQLHSLDGPAVEYADGSKEWFYYDICAKSEKEFYNELWRKEVLLRMIK